MLHVLMGCPAQRCAEYSYTHLLAVKTNLRCDVFRRGVLLAGVAWTLFGLGDKILDEFDETSFQRFMHGCVEAGT